MKLSKKLGLGLAAVFTAGVTVLTVYAIVNHEESGLMAVCWIGDNAYYPDHPYRGTRPECDPSPLVWPKHRMPLTVGIIGKERADKLTKAALNAVNQQLGEVLSYQGYDQQADVVVKWGYAISDDTPYMPAGAIATTAHYKVSGEMRCIIRMRDGFNDTMAWKALIEELGHAIGLDDQDSFGAMDGQTNQGDSVRFSDHDRALLKEQYDL